MMEVVIGIDPHKGSHTAVVIDTEEVIIDKLQVSASTAQTVELLGWAARFDQRRWAVESAAGLGYLLSHHGARPSTRQPARSRSASSLSDGST